MDMNASMNMSSTLGATKGKSGGGECVKVVVRVRPLSSQEASNGQQKIVDMDLARGVALLQKPGGSEKESKDFTYDAVFDERVSQQAIFDETALEIVESVMDGFNGTIFAYGQTGAGKSHTMTGPEKGDPVHQGLIPRSFRHIFQAIETAGTNVQHLVRGSYLEIYNEEIRDLLSKNPKERCELKDHPNSGVYVKDLTAFVVKSVEEMNAVLANGLANRSVSSTNMNKESSRSHSIFTITVEQCALDAEGEGHIRVGKLNMVDLAGSERQSKTGATGVQLKEATKINLSLSALGNVISALVDGRSQHIPYRDSKLTRLLQDSLGGNTKTVMVANIGPAESNFDESLSTLRYAYRAKSIKNKPRINEDPKDAMIREFQDEIMRLKAALSDEPEESSMDALPEPLPPRIEKKVEYVEKIVQKTVEKEIIIEQGPTAEEVAAMESKLREQNEELAREAERKRSEVTRHRDMVESEKKKLFCEIDREEQNAMEEQKHRMEMQTKLAMMEQKMVAGKSVMEKAIEQEEELKRQQRELRKRMKIEEKLKQQEEQQRLENLEIEAKCASQEEQVQKITMKLQKLYGKYQKAQQEMVDVQQFNQSEREDMLSMIRDLRQTLRVKTMIMEAFVPTKEIQATQERAYWDPEEDEWKLRPIKIDKENRPVRPASTLGLPRPTCEFARINRAMGDPNQRFMYDSVVMTDLDMPERTTEDYEVHPELGDRIEKALLLALSADDDGCGPDTQPGDENGQKKKTDRPSSGARKRPTSGRPGNGRAHSGIRSHGDSAFPQARGLVARE
uniref:Kinesin-like protein n=1 Tax=Noctiluca scintillans TaxID=2966 RepID=A0A7S1AHC0_NOCSC|mmetsp:Transcript_46281/g.122831  ORF Transcript_46281/g.122831 Transcript_46281/m.122831 type:complete len:792 (+) Transcript_46281:154-2529(+)